MGRTQNIRVIEAASSEDALTRATSLASGLVARELHGEFADLVAEKLADRLLHLAVEDSKAVDTRTICARFGLKEDWVRANYRSLGGFLMGDGSRARRRFVPTTVARHLANGLAQSSPSYSTSPEKPRRRRGTRTRSATGLTPSGVPLIELRNPG